MIASLLAYFAIVPAHLGVYHRFRETAGRLCERDAPSGQDHRFSIHQYQRDLLLLQWNVVELLVSSLVC
jgi:hypothetical protein